MTDSKCANAACATKAVGAPVSCPLCKQTAYCSEACRLTDWIGHACPNALVGTSAQQVPLVPYYYEDDMEPEQLQALVAEDGIAAHPSLQAYTITLFDKRGGSSVLHFPAEEIGATLQSRQFRPGALRGKRPSYDFAFTVTVMTSDQFAGDSQTGPVERFTGNASNDLIYKENETDRVRNYLGAIEKSARFADKVRAFGMRLRSRTSKDSSRYFMWPRPSSSRTGKTAFPLSGTLEVYTIVNVSGGTRQERVLKVQADYDFTSPKTRVRSKLSKATKYFTPRLKAKFAGTDVNPKDVSVHRMKATDGSTVILAVSFAGNHMFVEDVEVRINYNIVDGKLAMANDSAMPAQLSYGGDEDESSYESSYDSNYSSTEQSLLDAMSMTQAPIQWDAGSLEHVTALVMAAEMRPERVTQYASLCAALREHAQRLNEDPEAQPSDIAATAVYTLASALQA